MSISLLRLPVVQSRTGKGRTSIYKDIKEGTITKPVRIGVRTVAWPEPEVDAIIRARIAGKTDDQIRALVNELHTQRQGGAA